MSLLEIPRVDFNPELVDPFDEAIRLTWKRPNSPKRAPSPRPFHIGRIVNKEAFSTPIDFATVRTVPATEKGNVMAFTIPVDEQTGLVRYELPDGLEQFHDAIGLVAAHEHTHYPGKQYKKVKVLLDQNTIPKNSAHRGALKLTGQPLPHRDPSLDHIYGIADNQATRHLVSDIPIHPDDVYEPEDLAAFEATHEVYQATDYDVTQSNLLSVHYSPVFEEAAFRTFMRMAFIYA